MRDMASAGIAMRFDLRAVYCRFSRAFVGGDLSQGAPGIDIAALSVRASGNGKSWLAGARWWLGQSDTGRSAVTRPNVENVLVAASRAQAAIVLDFARAALGEDEVDHRWRVDGAIHIETQGASAGHQLRRPIQEAQWALARTRRLAVCDEPGSWAPQSGRRLLGRNDLTATLEERRMTIIAIGTLAPAALTGPASWWPDLHQTGEQADGRHVAVLQADPEKWKNFDEVSEGESGLPRSIRI